MATLEQIENILENTTELLRKTQTNLKKCPKARLTKGYIQTRIQCIEEYWHNYKQAHTELIKMTTREQRGTMPYFLNEDYYVQEDLFLSMLADLRDLLSVTPESSAPPKAPATLEQVKLPCIQLPVFSGNYEEWPTFKDLFVALVHDNASLTNVQRLHYLKTSITGEAAALLKHIQVTDTNYYQAWDILKSRFGNKRLIVNSLLKRLFAQKKCTSQTSSQLKSLLDTTNEIMNSLQNLGVPTGSWDPIIIFLVVQKLDSESHKEWEQIAYSENKEELSKWSELKKFLESKFQTLELVTPPSVSREKTSVRERVYHVSASEKCCVMCKDNHTLCRCKTFAKMQPSERSQYVQDNRLCFNCLAPGHSAFKCRVPMSCRICKRRHHTLLHQPNNTSASATSSSSERVCIQPTSSQATVEEKVVHTTMASTNEDGRTVSLLATAVVIVRGEHGHTTVLKALIDSGSQACFISEKAAQALKLERKQVNLIVTGMESMKVPVKHEVKFKVLSRWESNFELPIQAYVMSKHLTTNIPSNTKYLNEWPHLRGLNLADPKFYVSGTMDLLLGVEEYSKIIQQGLVKGPPGTPCAQKTSLGWIVMGGINIKLNTREKSLVAITQDMNIENLLKVMWEIETDTKRNLTKEEQLCEDIYEKTHTRKENGRYVVKLPFKTEHPRSSEGNTREIALKRFMQLERRFLKDPELKEEYTKVIEEYKELGHIEEVPVKEIENKSVYLPHHAVIRRDKESTQTRVVFDASSKGSNGISLNEELLPGPVLQDDLRDVIIRWRRYAIAFVCDIAKMYRMILVHKEDTDYQRILWRSEPFDDIKDYRLLTVTFGTTSAPYLAIKTLKQLAADEGDKFPEAAKIVDEQFYIDDCMFSCDSVSEAILISQEIRELLHRGGFELKKWASNNAEFMRSFEPSERSINAHVDLNMDGIIKALGIQWNLGTDQLEYNLNLPPMHDTVTKRSILSDMQKLFDPLGWIAPCTVIAKILLQKLWLKKVNWDENLTNSLRDEWIELRLDLEKVNEILIDRCMGVTNSNKDSLEIHGFSDASERAYAAVVYCRVKCQDNSYKTCLVAARTRVAPLKTLSLPRLELCGALLLSRLLKQVATAMRIPLSQVFAWTDSSIVISWLSGEPGRWKTFVANRVVEITSNVNSDQWYHVQSTDNPADIASRGMLVKDLKECDVWWKGPEWLSEEKIQLTKPNVVPTDLEKKKETIITLTLTNTEEEGKKLSERFHEFNTLTELLRTIAYCKRFLNKKVENKEEKIDENINTEEIEEALNTCIKIVQEQEFNEEINCLKNNKQVNRTSKLKTLDPYLDEIGILRVGGRLRNANIEENSKHPIILGKNNQLIPLIIAEAHTTTLHGGMQLMLCHLRSKYWILRARSLVKKHIHRCLICAKQNAKVKTQIMGDLPAVRVTPSRPFINAGVDFAGPFPILMSKGRGSKTHKAYIAIFICMSTKAIHLELVGDMTSEAFIGAYKRFSARRGKCAHLWSDQGRNFVGANRELTDAWKAACLEFEGDISDRLTNEGTQWHFLPVYSPNFGGLWEAGVKSIKHHLKRILTTHLTFEEMSTVLCSIEACLNSRPLCPIDLSDEKTEPLTPGHFLIGEAPITVPSPSLKDVKVGHLTRWQYSQKLVNDFWSRWQKEYLSRLQQRPKWLKRKSEFKTGDIVLIKQENLPPGKWALGRIIDKHPGPDGLTRVYSVKSGDNIVKRCVTKLCALPIDTD